MVSAPDMTVVPLFGQHSDAAALTAALYPRIRYMGSKYKLLPHLAKVFSEIGGSTALDAFSGSGVVSCLLKRQGFAVTVNDMLEFPGVLASATVVNNSVRLTAEDVMTITGPAADGRDFIRSTFTGIFFNPDDLQFLDSAWSHIAAMDGSKRALAISALVLSAARKQPRGVFTISGDLSSYDDGRRDLRISMQDHFIEHVDDYNRAVFEGSQARVTRQEASRMESRPYDLVYLDPPYAPPSDDNCYVKRFHFLEGLSRYWQGDTLMLDTLREVKRDVEVRAIPHTYHYGTHQAAARRSVDEYIFIAR